MLITDELLHRRAESPDYLQESLALQDLAHSMADHPTRVLQRLVTLALDICEGESAGVSVLEGDVFRWYALKGKLATFEGTTTPRDWSPCGVCLDRRDHVLMRHPEEVYGWIAEGNIVVPEVLLLPLLANGKDPIGTVWIVGERAGAFNAEHARVMKALAAFTGVALHMIQTDVRLKKVLDEQQVLAWEMSHRVKNVFAVTSSMVTQAARVARSKDELVQSVVGRLQAMSHAHDLVGSSVARPATQRTADLRDLLATFIEPHGTPDLAGPSLILNERAVHALSLVVHELATNAVKYGAFSQPDGLVAVRWVVNDGRLTLTWKETGGPLVVAVAHKGFGTTLVRSMLASIDGKVSNDWPAEGIEVTVTAPIDRLISERDA